jgi:hypothetical protein
MVAAEWRGYSQRHRRLKLLAVLLFRLACVEMADCIIAEAGANKISIAPWGTPLNSDG